MKPAFYDNPHEPKYSKDDNYHGKWIAALLCCLRCEHEWAGVYPDNCSALECPWCGYFNPRYLVEPPRDDR